MTFEEFFIKKKVDLVELKKAEPLLYTEFKGHFAAMGEKSFDHTKKFWFNKLRRLYHLAPVPKAVPQAETAIASQAEPLSSPTIEQKPAFTPRFKSLNKDQPEPQTETTAAAEKPAVKPAFKPRNIPSKTTDQKTGETGAVPSTTPPPAKTPGFKPRNIKPAEEKSEPIAKNPPEEIQSATNPGPKKAPGFKPRNIKPASAENAAGANNLDSSPDQLAVSETPISNPEKQEEAAKQVYKPKFKLKNTPRNPNGGEEHTDDPVKQQLVPEIQTDSPVESEKERNISSSTDDKTPEQEIQDNAFDLRGSDDEKPLDEAPKPAYKPKFNLKNIKPKSRE